MPSWWLPRTTVRSSPNCDVLVMKMPVVAVAARNVEPARHRNHHLTRLVAYTFEPRSLPIEERRRPSMNRRPVVGEPDRIHDVGP